MNRKLVAALACRNQGSRLYGKPLQNLDVNSGYSILDNIVGALRQSNCVDEIVLGISKGVENEIFKEYAEFKKIKYIVGDEHDVLSRLIQCGHAGEASDIFRVTTESPFRYFEIEYETWVRHISEGNDATFVDNIIDGCGLEIIRLNALEKAHTQGEARHRSELCTLFIRENPKLFKIERINPPTNLIRPDLRLTVDNPEDLIVCRNVFMHFKECAPLISVEKVVEYLDKKPFLKDLLAPYVETGYASMYL